MRFGLIWQTRHVPFSRAHNRFIERALRSNDDARVCATVELAEAAGLGAICIAGTAGESFQARRGIYFNAPETSDGRVTTILGPVVSIWLSAITPTRKSAARFLESKV
ncbi:MAG: hypothetical protein WKF30_12390 [Pyrinomonadaceae bacterium]